MMLDLIVSFASPLLFIIVIVVILFSYALYLVPTILHRQRDLGIIRSKVSTIGHRGSRYEGIAENSIASFKEAIKLGVDVIELDVWMSKDGEVVVFHDSDFKRMTSGKCLGTVTETPFKDFPRLVQPSSDRDGEYSELDRCRIPLLSDVLSLVPQHVCMIIEFKQDSNALIHAVLQLLLDKNRVETTFWFSLKESINSKLRRFDSRIPTICSEIGMLKILFAYYLGILPFIPIPDAVFGITTEEVIYVLVCSLLSLHLLAIMFNFFLALCKVSFERIANNETVKKFPAWLHRILAAIFSGCEQ
jgi:hypothetical protein